MIHASTGQSSRVCVIYLWRSARCKSARAAVRASGSAAEGPAVTLPGSQREALRPDPSSVETPPEPPTATHTHTQVETLCYNHWIIDVNESLPVSQGWWRRGPCRQRAWRRSEEPIPGVWRPETCRRFPAAAVCSSVRDSGTCSGPDNERPEETPPPHTSDPHTPVHK